MLGSRSWECELLWSQHLSAGLKKKSNKMNACAALAAGVRVLGCYQGLKMHPGGVLVGGWGVKQ